MKSMLPRTDLYMKHMDRVNTATKAALQVLYDN